MSLLSVVRKNGEKGEFLCHYHDTKLYKIVNLPNNLTAVLISSKDETGNYILLFNH